MKDLNLLYVFEALWRERSVTAAAESLGLGQAAVSSSLKRLRTEYGDKLFVLVARRMEPTPQATALAPQLLEALATVRRTRMEPPAFQAGASTRLFTIRTRDIGEVVCLPAVRSKLEEVAPGIRLKTVASPLEETLSGLASGRIDLALGFLPTLETGIHSKPFIREHYVCAMRAGHPLARRRLTLDDFMASDHLLVEYSGSGYQDIERQLVNAGARARIKVRLPQYLAAPHFVTSSDLLWAVPARLAATLARHFQLVVKPLPFALPSFDVALYWHGRFHRDPANIWLRNFVSARFDAARPASRPAR
jgi:DNA-binding transcriptional LysR family regulator